MGQDSFDIFVIGGGVNGCGIARDAAGRGYSVYLAEMDDLASGTSSSATKLIHGGLRYLEHYAFSLVREALEEREVLWAMAPHIISPLRFVLPHHRGLRPRWLLRAGLFLYDYIGGRKKLPVTKTLNLKQDPAGLPLRADYRTGFEYSDCRVDDARLVALNACDAAQKGASINTRAKVISGRRGKDDWVIEVEHQNTGKIEIIRTKMLINAAGPWADKVLGALEGHDKVHNVRLVKGSHIVVDKLFDHDRCYIFQTADGRVIFAIPYEHDFTLIGTTDQDYDGDPSEVSISSEELNYLCDVASEYFQKPVERSRVVWAYSGVRPLYDDGAGKAQEATRDYVLKLEQQTGNAPLINIFGGKLTTYRRLAEDALKLVEQAVGKKGPAWTAGSSLPGGDFPMDGFEDLFYQFSADYPFLTPGHARRLLHLYGTKARDLLGDVTSLAALGENFGSNLTALEVDYLIREEWAQTVEDILWRRTKMGLRLDERDVRALEIYLQNKTAGTAS